MQAEYWARGDVLDMTWVRFRSIFTHARFMQKIIQGGGLNHDDQIELQKRADGKT